MNQATLSPSNHSCDVTVIGGGLAGKAAALHLAGAGLRVICVAPPPTLRAPVGESLDWSAPALLERVGMPMEAMVEGNSATWKRHVILRTPDGCSTDYVPTPWLGGAPFHIELRTLHVDRFQMDEQLMQKMLDAGIQHLHEQVVLVESEKNRVTAVATDSGSRVTSPWYIDASGLGKSLFAREFRIPAIQYGPAKIGMWTYFDTDESMEGTTLYMDDDPEQYLKWIWEIPIRPGTVSVGYVVPGDRVKQSRAEGVSVEEIFTRQLGKFPRFARLLQREALGHLNVTSYRCRIHLKSAGANWLMAGEAAAMVDPITANGVTAALRQAEESSALILRYRQQAQIPALARWCYSTRVLQLAKFFNSGIEKIVYEPPVRNRFGLARTGTMYTSPAWTMNVVYARMRPRGIVSTAIYCSMLGVFRAAAWLLHRLCARKGSRRGTRSAGALPSSGSPASLPSDQ